MGEEGEFCTTCDGGKLMMVHVCVMSAYGWYL